MIASKNRSIWPLVSGLFDAGADVTQLGSSAHVAGEVGGLEAGAVIGDEDQRRELTGLRVGAVLEQRPAEQVAHAVAGGLDDGDRVAVGLVGVTGQPSASLAW